MPLEEPIGVDFGTDGNKDLMDFVHENIMSLKTIFDKLHTEKVAKWERLYKGTPRQTTKNFPWKDASNVVIQLIGENVEIVKARILGSIYEIMPLWPTGLLGEWNTEEQGAQQQEAVHQFLNYCGLEPNELDLYRVESAAATEEVKYGTVVIKLPWIKDMEAEAIGIIGDKREFKEFTKYEGPRPEKLEFTKWAATPTAPNLDQAPFKYHIVTLKRWQLEERFFNGTYKITSNEGETEEQAEERFLCTPDRPTISDQDRKLQESKGLSVSQYKEDQEWDIHECWLMYWHNGKRYRIIYSYHLNSKQCLRKIFNFYPRNEEPWEFGRLGYNDDGLLGYGFCEMLEHYQEEVTTGHNQRVDNRTLANTSILRVDPDSKLDAIFSVYPNALVPAKQDDIEKIQLGSVYPTSVEEEQLTIGLAKSRAGTQDPGIQASGGGTQNAKRGVYSAMGTFSVLQAGNRRVNINITDFRYTHLRLGRKFLNQYAHFGIGERLKKFGQQAKYLEMALKNVKDGRLELPIRAATASINKELEKQNDMLLTQVLQRHYMGIAQILQAIQNPQLDPEARKYFIGWIDASSVLMGRILRNFGFDDVSRLLPERKIVEAVSGGGSNGRGQQGANAGAGTGTTEPASPVQQDFNAQGGGSNSMAVSAGGRDVSSLPI